MVKDCASLVCSSRRPPDVNCALRLAILLSAFSRPVRHSPPLDAKLKFVVVPLTVTAILVALANLIVADAPLPT